MNKNEISIKIGNNTISNSSKTYFIADIAANWDGSLSRAKQLIYQCAESGADAAKFQNFNVETYISDYGFTKLSEGRKLAHQSSWEKSVYQVFKDASLPIEWTKELKNTCKDAGIDYFTTPYDIDQIDQLSKYVQAWKIGSGDITWHDLIEKVSKDNKPILIATGASTLKEIELALSVALKHTKQVVLFQCNTNYTADPNNFKHIHLNVLKNYKKKFPEVILGLSDHTLGHATVLGAVAIGARVIEKHFTDDNSRDGPDHKFSMTPTTWSEMVNKTRELEYSLGFEIKKVEENEMESAIVQRRSIRTRKTLLQGATINKDDVIMLRPISSEGLPPYKLNEIIGKKIVVDLPAGEEIKIKYIKEDNE